MRPKRSQMSIILRYAVCGREAAVLWERVYMPSTEVYETMLGVSKCDSSM